MARREFNIFSISFLDLLSGALGALIILFLIMPKMTQEQAESVQTLDSLKVHADQISEMIDRLENSVDREIAQQLQQELERLQQSTQQVQQQMEAQQIQNRQLREQLEEATVDRGGGGQGAEMFGVSAEFAVVSKWDEVDLDVDLYLVDRNTGKMCNYQNTDPGFAKYLADIQRRERRDENLYEMIYQPKIKPGNYDIYLHLYSSSGTANVKTFAVFYPFTNREKKLELPTRAIQHNNKPPQGGYKLGTITISPNTISLQ